jgi:hypothetical protein
MKREALLRHLRRNGCVLKREGRSHSLWINPQTRRCSSSLRHPPSNTPGTTPDLHGSVFPLLGVPCGA